MIRGVTHEQVTFCAKPTVLCAYGFVTAYHFRISRRALAHGFFGKTGG